MKKAIAILAVLSFVAFAGGQFAVDLDVVEGADGDWLRYDNGTPVTYIAGPVYFGTWFNTEDFIPGFGGAEVLQSEIWFYHGPVHRWDTSDVYFEIWNGGVTGPTTQLDQTSVVATHFAPNRAIYSTPLATEANFWLLINTEQSHSGFPSSVCDDAGAAVAHSFCSDNMVAWEPVVPTGGAGNGNLIAGVEVDPLALGDTTWGSLKTIF